jgi:hypothetical protein
VRGSHLPESMDATTVTARRHIVCMTVPGAASTELTAELEWHEAEGALRTLRRLFANAQAVAEGWAAEPVAHGFHVAKGGCTATFVVAAAGSGDLAGRLGLITASKRTPSPHRTG